VWESELGGNIIIMYVRGNKRPVESVQGMGESIIVKENDGLGEFHHDTLQKFLMSHCIHSTTMC
jgi:hypothetical protein